MGEKVIIPMFTYKNRELYCEKVAISKIAKKVGTPFYLYSLGEFESRFDELKKAFKGVNPLICFSVKSNSNLTVLKRLVSKGAGLDIVSGGELFRAKKIGANSKKIVFASVGKSEQEIEDAIRAKILLFNVESEDELGAINRVAARLKKVQNVALRINPHVQPKTHKYITTGSKENKFGLDMDSASELYLNSEKYPYLKFSGVHLHIGSQITEAKPFVEAIKKASAFIANLKSQGVFVKYLNIGGGLGIVYENEKPQTAAQYAKAVKPLLQKLKVQVILEPGRFVAGNSGILVTSVLYWKESQFKKFAIVDAGMNDLLRPSIYSAYHKIAPVDQRKAGPSKNWIPHVDVVGPICESGDFLGKDRLLPTLSSGDLLAVFSCGAYSFTMSGNYNSRPRIPEVVVKGGRFAVAKRRETYKDLVQGEIVAKI